MRGETMRTRKSVLYSGISGITFAVGLVASIGGMSAGQLSSNVISIDNDDLGGVVTSAKGPEAGVWVIAETTDLPHQVRENSGHR
jgi:hypothetical protein